MRYPISYLFVGLVALSLSQLACPKQVKKEVRKVLAYGRNYKDWKKINQSKVISRFHGNTEKDVYTNELGYKTFMGVKKLPYPMGATFVVIHFKDSEIQPYAYVMRKMDANYDPDRGNWRYTIVRISDWTIEQDGRIAVCINCHEQSAMHDYIKLDRKLFQNNPL